MIRSFKQKNLEAFFTKGDGGKVPAELRKRVRSKLDMMWSAMSLRSLTAAPGNQLHPLQGKRRGEYALHVSGPWCLTFRYKDGNFYDIGLEQYH